MEPILLKPVGKDYLWGGERLKNEYGKIMDMYPLAETWECSVHKDGKSIVASGDDKGITLAELLHRHPEYIGTKAGKDSELPILVKFIDAKQNLSVQVHPDDEYALAHEHQNGKTEMWYVVDAEPGSSLIYGFAHPMTKEKLKNAIDRGTLDKHLQKIPVYKNDVFYIPAGTVHAIGAGILIAEIQESSNVTYRVYDYNRVDKNGKKRELHFDKAVEVMDMSPGMIVRQPPRTMHYYPGCSREILCRCKYFETERIIITKGFSFSVLENSFQVLLCLDGSGGIECDGLIHPLRFSKGACVFLPAGLGRCHVIGEAVVLKVRC